MAVASGLFMCVSLWVCAAGCVCFSSECSGLEVNHLFVMFVKVKVIFKRIGHILHHFLNMMTRQASMTVCLPSVQCEMEVSFY